VVHFTSNNYPAPFEAFELGFSLLVGGSEEGGRKERNKRRKKRFILN